MSFILFFYLEAAIDALQEKEEKALHAKDADAIVQGYTKDCKILLEGRDIINGREGTTCCSYRPMSAEAINH